MRLDKDQAHTFRDREIYEDAGYRLCPLLEDCNDFPRREHAEKGISIKEFRARPQQSTSITQRKCCGNIPRYCTWREVVIGIARGSRKLCYTSVGKRYPELIVSQGECACLHAGRCCSARVAHESPGLSTTLWRQFRSDNNQCKATRTISRFSVGFLTKSNTLEYSLELVERDDRPIDSLDGSAF